MLYAEGMSQKLSATEIRAQAVCTFQDVLHYTPEAADQGVQHCIEATAPGGHDTMRAILHRGIDGHRQYLDGDMQALGENLISILERFASHQN